MKCIIPGTNIKVFGRAVQSLSKIGDELYIEPLNEGLALRTVNSSRSAYACFLFAPSFFQHYDDGSGQEPSPDSDDGIRCKIAMKSVLSVYKSLSSMEKSVEICKINLNTAEARLVFQLHCRHGIVKTHNLAFIECETLQAVFSRDMCPNSLTASARLLCDAVMNFQNNQEEITLMANPEKIVLKNYVDDEPDPTKVMHTELCLDPDEFDNCQIGVDTDITFCLKELRAILAFSEVTNLPLTLRFETASRPVVFSMDGDSNFEANFVLATLAEQQTQSTGQAASKPRNTQTQKRSYQQSRQTASTSGREQGQGHTAKKSTNTNQSMNRQPDRGRGDRLDAAFEELMDDTHINEMSMMIDTPSRVNPDKTVTSRLESTTNPDSSATSQIIPFQGTSNDGRENTNTNATNTTNTATTAGSCQLADVSLMEKEEEEEDAVPGTPPSKRFRSLLFGFSQDPSQISQSKALSTSSVLVVDTDEEDSS